MSKLIKAKNKLQSEGFFGLIKYILRFFYLKIRPPFQVLIAIFKLKTLNKDLSNDQLLDFSLKLADGVIAPLQVRSEITSLMNAVKEKNPKIYVEIGTASGGTLFLITKVLASDTQIISLDLPKGKFGGGYPVWKIPIFQSFTSGKQTMTLLRGDSHSNEMLERLKKVLNGKTIDFLFIDGDHTYEGVKQDFEMYSPLVSKDGMIGFHDIAIHPVEKDTQVDKLWNELKGKYKSVEFIEDKNQGAAGIGIIYIGQK